MACVFCEIAANRPNPDLIAFEDAHLIALPSLHQKPRNFGHTLLLPKQHVETLYDLPPACDASVTSALRLMARSVKRAFAADGVAIRQNNEPAAGQDVFHLHFHVIPRFRDDGFEASQYERRSLDMRSELANRLKLAVEIERSI